MSSLNRWIDRVMRFFVAVSLFLLVIFGTWQIVSRWILANPSTFTDELLRFVMIWAALIGSAYCFFRNQHLALTLVTDRLKGKAKMVVSVFIEVCILFFVWYVFWKGGAALAQYSTNYSPVMHIPYKILYAVLPAVGVLVIVARIVRYVEAFLAYRSGKKEGAA